MVERKDINTGYSSSCVFWDTMPDGNCFLKVLMEVFRPTSTEELTIRNGHLPEAATGENGERYRCCWETVQLTGTIIAIPWVRNRIVGAGTGNL